MEDAEAAGITLDALANLGVRIAIDDFGTGYSSLVYLRRYPISVLKIDRAFVAGIGISPDDEAICGSVLGLAQAVGATSIAEGVETPEQYAALRGLGCQEGQGFLWSPAVPIDDLEDVLVACRTVDIPRPKPRGRKALRGLDPDVTARIVSLRNSGLSLNSIAIGLNRSNARNPAGGRWTAHVVGRHCSSW
jgi:predicted signal transduction protein with EAL and GGDEF domain